MNRLLLTETGKGILLFSFLFHSHKNPDRSVPEFQQGSSVNNHLLGPPHESVSPENLYVTWKEQEHWVIKRKFSCSSRQQTRPTAAFSSPYRGTRAALVLKIPKMPLSLLSSTSIFWLWGICKRSVKQPQGRKQKLKINQKPKDLIKLDNWRLGIWISATLWG